MKTKTWVLSNLIILFLMVSCQSQQKKEVVEPMVVKEAPQLDIETEKIKLKKLIALETKLFNEKKTEEQLALAYKGPNLVAIQKTPSGEVLTAKGHTALLEGARQFRVQNPDFVVENVKRSDYVFSITQQMAYATYVQKGEIMGQPIESHEIRVFQKQNGEWKIALLSTIQ